jgi:hypothetical protein
VNVIVARNQGLTGATFTRRQRVSRDLISETRLAMAMRRDDSAHLNVANRAAIDLNDSKSGCGVYAHRAERYLPRHVESRDWKRARGRAVNKSARVIRANSALLYFQLSRDLFEHRPPRAQAAHVCK